MYAFWKYDQYPYLLGGIVTDYRVTPSEGDIVMTKEYGPNWFRPVVLVPNNIGETLLKDLRGLRIAYKAAQSKLKEEYERELDTMLIGANIWGIN